MTDSHADAVLAIYQAGIDEGNATFESRAPSWAAFTTRRLPAHRYIAADNGTVLGWVACAASKCRNSSDLQVLVSCLRSAGDCNFNGVTPDK